MKKRILHTLEDIISIMIVFSITDWLMLNVFHTEKILPEVLVYIIIYGLVFGAKWLIRYFWCKVMKKAEKNDIKE